MFRVYFVKENEYGTCIDGPNGHRWVCKPEDGFSRATGFAKALERAYLEGQKSITQDLDLAVVLEMLEDLGTVGDITEFQARVDKLIRRSADSRRKLANIRALNAKHQINKATEEADAAENQGEVKGAAVTENPRIINRRRDPRTRLIKRSPGAA